MYLIRYLSPNLLLSLTAYLIHYRKVCVWKQKIYIMFAYYLK